MISRMMYVRRGMLVAALLFLSCHIYAQDTLRLTVNDADKLFLQNNLQLIAAKLNVSIQQAAEVQAKLYPNPNVTVEVNAVDPQNNKYFNVGAAGEKMLGIEQLILTGSKRKYQVAIVKKNTAYAQLLMEDVMRDLRQQLHTSLYSVHFDELTLIKYNNQLALLDTIISSYQVQVDKGNISVKELVRLKSVYLALNNERTELLQNIEQEQADLRILLQTESYVKPNISTADWDRYQKIVAVAELEQTAINNRPDAKMAEVSIGIADLNLKYQKSLAVPDLTLGSGYDQRGGAFNNQVDVSLGMQLPFWNRNQGGIKSAKYQQQTAKVQQEISTNQIKSEVIAAYNNLKHSLEEYNKYKVMYNADFNNVLSGMTDNFRKRNISIIEFVDYFEAYNVSLAAINRAKKQVAICAENINYTTASSVY